MSDQARDRYLIALYDWLDQQRHMDPRWLSWLIGVAEWYDANAKAKVADASGWKESGR